jgi:hypothetical protein
MSRKTLAGKPKSSLDGNKKTALFAVFPSCTA